MFVQSTMFDDILVLAESEDEFDAAEAAGLAALDAHYASTEGMPGHPEVAEHWESCPPCYLPYC